MVDSSLTINSLASMAQPDRDPTDMIELTPFGPEHVPEQGAEPSTEIGIRSTPQPSAPEPNSAHAVITSAIEVAIEIKDYRKRGLPRLNFKPTVLQPWMLILCTIANLVWIVLLCIALKKKVLRGPEFILGGPGAGYIATFLRFFVAQQAMNIGQIMPYLSMSAEDNNHDRHKMENTIDADYWPYEWPIVRIRALRNKHFFFYFVDLASFFSTITIVQFESNILGEADDDHGSLVYTPNKGVVYISIACHAVFALIAICTLAWLQWKDTGLLAAPGSIAMYLAMLRKSDVQEDYRGLEAEARRWKVREHLLQNIYRIGYWERDKAYAVYGIRRMVLRPHGDSENQDAREMLRRSGGELPRFDYIPWFLRPFNIAVSAALLAAGLSIALTLLADENILKDGFTPRVSTEPTPFVDISPAAFLWSFLPSLAADQYRLLVKSIDMFYRLVQPYADLKRKKLDPERVIECFTVNYTNDLPIIISIKALRNQHWKVGFMSAFSFVSSFIPAFAANMFFPDTNEDSNWRIFVWQRYFFIVIAYMGVLIVILIIFIPDKTRYMPHDLETISDHISLLSQSSLLNDDKYKYKYGIDLASGGSAAASQSSRPDVADNGAQDLGIWQKLKTKMSSFYDTAKQILKEANPWLLSPPVKNVKQRLKDLQNEKRDAQSGEEDALPRFAIWREDREFACGIDSNRGSKMISLYDDDYYQWNIPKRAKEFFI